jgi:RHS repeat-associated protein
MVSGGEDWTYLYTADDERIWSYSAALSRWTLRDLDGKVLREYLSDSRGWSLANDYLYRDGLLLAAETQTGRRHFHLDHLGTPRLITRVSGDKVAYHVYYPFGEEATAFNQDTERMKFTGHERDLASPAGTGDDLDYMHARHESPLTGRFLGTDVVEGKAGQPQSWNRYAYVRNNPLKFLDPDGQETASVFMCPGTLSCGGPLPVRQEIALWGGIVSAGALAGAGAAVLTGSVGVTSGATTVGEALTLLGAKFQKVFDVLRDIGAGITGTPSAPSRALTVADLGVQGSISELKGTFSVSEGAATVRIDMIRGSIRNPFQIIENLAKLASKAGASTLRIEGTIANEKLYEVLAKRYGLQTEGATDYILIQLAKTKPPA